MPVLRRPRQRPAPTTIPSFGKRTSAKKGYKEVSLASTKIGSQKARGTSSGEVDAKTLQKIQSKDGAAAVVKNSTLQPGIQDLVRYIYDEATHALTTSVAAKITANGIETPLGVLTLGQIEKGEQILLELYDVFQKKKKDRVEMERLTGEFYTAIPHRIGRTRAAVDTAVIETLEVFEQKQNILQLMKDMLQVNGEGGNVLFDARIDQEYEALSCEIEGIEPANPKFRELSDYLVKSLVKTKDMRVKNIYKLKRNHEWDAFTTGIGNQRLLFHGSRIQNWVGILSRGILLPKIVVSLGVNRTDAGGWGTASTSATPRAPASSTRRRAGTRRASWPSPGSPSAR